MTIERIIRLTQRISVPEVDKRAGWEPVAAHDRIPEIRRIAEAMLKDFSERKDDA